MCVSRLAIEKDMGGQNDEREIQVDLHFYGIVAMEKVHTASTASDDSMKRLFDEFERAKDTLQKDFNRAKDDFDKAKAVLGKAKNQIHEGFEELREDQDALAAENGGLDADGSEILDINAGGIIISVTRDTLTQIKGTRLEVLFSGRWDKRLPRDGNGRIFLDINFTCFRAAVEYLNELKIAPSTVPRKCHIWERRTTLFSNSFCWSSG